MSTTGTQTSVARESPEITAPARLEGQSNADVLFDWLIVNRYLWMLSPPHDADLERLVQWPARFRLEYKLIEWRREPNAEGHEALVAPSDGEARRAAFARLKRLLEVHLFDTDGSGHG